MIENIYPLLIFTLSYYTSWTLITLPLLIFINIVFIFRPVVFVSIITTLYFLFSSQNAFLIWIYASVMYVFSVYFYTNYGNKISKDFKELPCEILSTVSININNEKILENFLLITLVDIISVPIIATTFLTHKWFKETARPTKCDNAKMIIFIHGDDTELSQWLLFRLILDFFGYDNHFSINLFTGKFNNTHPNEHMSLLLCSDIAKAKIELKMTDNVKEIILIGYGLGGLVSAHLAENGLKDKVKRVISLSSPFNGTHIVDCPNNFGLMNTGLYREYLAFSQKDLLTQIRKSNVEYFFIAGQSNILLLPSTIVPEKVSDRYTKKILPDIGRYSVKIVPETVHILLNLL